MSTPDTRRMNRVEDSYPLSSMQQGMLFHTLAASVPGVYIQQLVCRLEEALDIVAFVRAWQQIVDRHPVLRTTFQWEGQDEQDEQEEPLQVVHPRASLPYELDDWRGVSDEEQDELLRVYLSIDRQEGFDLMTPPLMRLCLIRLAQAKYVCVDLAPCGVRWSFSDASSRRGVWPV